MAKVRVRFHVDYTEDLDIEDDLRFSVEMWQAMDEGEKIEALEAYWDRVSSLPSVEILEDSTDEGEAE